jgi:hypothetical protein
MVLSFIMSEFHLVDQVRPTAGSLSLVIACPDALAGFKDLPRDCLSPKGDCVVQRNVPVVSRYAVFGGFCKILMILFFTLYSKWQY